MDQISVGTEPESDPADPYSRRAQTFPHLSEEMIKRIESYGTADRCKAGDMLFRAGDRGVDFFVVVDGTLQMLNVDAQGDLSPFITHGRGEFTGELDLFNNREVLVSCAAETDVELIRVERESFRRFVSAEPDIGEIVLRAFILRRVGLIQHPDGGAVIIGPLHAADTLRLQNFLTRNAYPFRLLDTDEDKEATGALDCFNLRRSDLPAVIARGQHVLRNPSNSELADRLGLTEALDPEQLFDLAVVGAGPAGLAAAVYGASEGLKTIVLEAIAPGGQAGTSSRIENYLGFPTGISGQALAGRAQVQAQKFGARLAIARAVTGLRCDEQPFRLELDDGSAVSTRAVVVATGARYRKLQVDNYERFEGQGIHYAATAVEARLCTGAEVIVAGGGNSAGQAAMFLSRMASHVHILVRGAGLSATMSDYLVQRIENSPKVSLHAHSEITALGGEDHLRTVSWTNRQSDEVTTRDIASLFVMIGAEPNTAWLNGCLELDEKGFVVTGRDAAGTPLASPYQTSRPGIYTVGDVRSGSVKRVAAGVGEGSVVVQAIHAYLAEHGDHDSAEG